MNARLKTATEVAETLRVHPSSVRKLAQRGDLRCYLVGKRLRFSEEQVEDYLRRIEQRGEPRIASCTLEGLDPVAALRVLGRSGK